MVEKMLFHLKYPDASSIDLNDEAELRKIVYWLEDTLIHKYTPEQRKKILNVTSPDWNKGYSKYKKDMNCPITTNTFVEELIWFMGCGIKAEYTSKQNVYGKHIVANLESVNVPNIIADNPLDKLDFGSKDFEDSTKELAAVLKIPPYPNIITVHKAASKIISNRLNKISLENPKDYVIKGTPFPFESMDVGIDFGDEQLNKAIKILHLLYIHNLRDLQTKANELIVAVQSITANPKTDTKLGKVGV